MKLKRFEGNPILSPNPKNYWETEVTTNPGAFYNAAEKKFYILYRAAGQEAEHKIYFGLAVSEDGFHFTRVSDEPVFSPSADGIDAGCVEDPRIVKMGDYYYITYAARPYPPGMYWLEREKRPYNPPDCPAEFPQLLRNNDTITCLAITKDFRTFKRAGRLTSPLLDDRDVILFPEKIGGKFYMMHRPMTWCGKNYGTEHPAMWLSSGDDLFSISGGKLMAKAEYEWEKKIGGNTPPIKTPYGWVTLYHAVGEDKYYRLGAMLLDLNDPSIVIGRTRDWLLQPEEEYETKGYYNGVVFPCGKVVVGDTLFVYYGGADKYVGVATCSFAELVDSLRSSPV